MEFYWSLSEMSEKCFVWTLFVLQDVSNTQCEKDNNSLLVSKGVSVWMSATILTLKEVHKFWPFISEGTNSITFINQAKPDLVVQLLNSSKSNCQPRYAWTYCLHTWNRREQARVLGVSSITRDSSVLFLSPLPHLQEVQTAWPISHFPQQESLLSIQFLFFSYYIFKGLLAQGIFVYCCIEIQPWSTDNSIVVVLHV